MENDWLSIGRMAQLNCISDKTLRFYHDKGVLVPEHADPDNGRRYYALEQCSTLDFIQQLQTAGLSLQAIKDVLDNRNHRLLRDALTECMAELDHQQQVLNAALAATREMIGGLDFFDHDRAGAPPITRMSCPEQRLWEFPLGQDGLENIDGYDYDDALAVWLRDLRQVKVAIADALSETETDIPVALLFRNVGARYTQQACREESPAFASAFVAVPPVAWKQLGDRLTTVPAGEYLVLEGVGMAEEGTNERATVRSAQRLFRHALDEGLNPQGDCLVEVPSDIPALLRGKSEDAFRVRLRIEP